MLYLFFFLHYRHKQEALPSRLVSFLVKDRAYG
nr:MAG TPA: hypothetical protein [Caudoviricetes sp.]